MSENRLKSSLLEKYSPKTSSILSTSKSSTSLLSSSLLKATISNSNLKATELQQKPLEANNSLSLDRKTKISPLDSPIITDSSAKKSKLLTHNENSLTNTGLLSRPSIFATSSLTSKVVPLLSPTTSLLLNRVSLKSSTPLTSSQSQVSILAAKTEEVISHASKRPYFHLESSESVSLFMQDEYLKTDALILAINQEQAKYEEAVSRAKKLKTASPPVFMDNSLVLKNELTIIQRQKNVLINAISGSLLRQPNFKNRNDPTRLLLLGYAEAILSVDPEFVLKLALYTRQELNIRVTANFLLCLAANRESCRPYLGKYFKASIVLPSDWIEVAEQYQLFMDKNLNFGSLPSALRKVMAEKFADFDKYQLAKYNKEKSRMAKNKSMQDVKHVKSRLKDAEGNEPIANTDLGNANN